MMIIDIAALLAALAFVALVGYLVPTIVQIKRTVGESERLLARLNLELPGLLKDISGTSENVRGITDQAKEGITHASTFLNAVGEIGHTVHQVHGAVRGRSGAFVLGLTSVLAGLKAAGHSVKHHFHKEGGNTHGT